MKTIRTIHGKTSIAGATAVVFGVLTMPAAQAHITFANETVAEESTVLAILQVPHGCGVQATTELRVELPEGFVLAKPQPKPGWDLQVINGDYGRAYDDHGTPVTSGAVEIRWSNGNLPDAFFDTFAIRGKISGIRAGAALAFPVTQICGADSERWDEVVGPGSNPHGLKHPAPVLTIVAGQADAHTMSHGAAADTPQSEHAGHEGMDMGHGAGAASSDAATGGMTPVKVGALTVSAGFVRAMLPGQPVGGGFVTVTNNGDTDDRLMAAASPLAGMVELHDMAMQGEVMRMRRVDDGIVIPAGKTVTLTPGGLHLMFMKLTTPFAAGTRVAASLTFEKAGKVDIVLPVLAAGQTGMPAK